jgi:hypothetical protein
VRQCVRIGEVVYGDELDVVTVEARTDNISANAAEAIDAYSYRHFFSCSPLLNYQNNSLGDRIDDALAKCAQPPS